MATELGQAYVQIMPSAKGISGSIQSALAPEATAAGNSAGSSIVLLLLRQRLVLLPLQELVEHFQQLSMKELLFNNRLEELRHFLRVRLIRLKPTPMKLIGQQDCQPIPTWRMSLVLVLVCFNL